MASGKAALEALRSTVPLYGQVQLAQVQFRRELCSWLRVHLQEAAPALEACGLRLDADGVRDVHSRSKDEEAWAVFVSAPIAAFPGVSDCREACLHVGLAWPMEPRGEASQSLHPQAFIEVETERAPQKRKFKEVLKGHGALPRQYEWHVGVDRSLLVLRDGGGHRESLEALDEDLRALVKALCHTLPRARRGG